MRPKTVKLSNPEVTEILEGPEMEKASVKAYGSWEEFMLLPKWREWALKHLGAENREIGVDLFASIAMRASDLFITREMDAFTFDWASLYPAPNDILWATPPSMRSTA